MKNNTDCLFLIYGMSFEAKLRFRLLGTGQPQPHERPLKLSILCDLFSLFLGVSDEKNLGASAVYQLFGFWCTQQNVSKVF